MADGVADSDEIDFLEELVSDRWTLNFVQSGEDGAAIAFPPLRSDGRGPIIAALDGEWDSAWDGGDEGWQRIVDLYTSPHHHGVGPCAFDRATPNARRLGGPQHGQCLPPVS